MENRLKTSSNTIFKSPYAMVIWNVRIDLKLQFTFGREYMHLKNKNDIAKKVLKFCIRLSSALFKASLLKW